MICFDVFEASKRGSSKASLIRFQLSRDSGVNMC